MKFGEFVKEGTVNEGLEDFVETIETVYGVISGAKVPNAKIKVTDNLKQCVTKGRVPFQIVLKNGETKSLEIRIV
jgi:hypothetical protein